jgi:diaminopimelate epimerase
LKLYFSKYHGAGNDFIMVDSRKNANLNLSVKTIRTLCDRHFGIGADGLIMLQESSDADFRMDYYNADGLPGTMCGNGGRCISAFALKNKWINKDCIFEASDGLHSTSFLSNGNVRLEMRDVLNVKTVDQGYFLNTGSPHLVIFETAIDTLDVYQLGRKYRYDKAYTEGTNVNFIEFKEDGIKVRTYERGVENETLSCGTGVTASAIASFLHSKNITNKVKVETTGGNLLVDFTAHESNTLFKDIHLTGPAEEVFEGEVRV